ncbi:unnamed protein product [Meloidogyne enterolobii]|uniref:Uncharacterized protein n=1 Tax=Meloidogyne enterolobii TaxID=390850 RepID=A0ACB0ZQG1_MELEN
MSTGTILLATALPAFVVKYAFPFFMNRIPFGFRIFLVCFTHSTSYILVAFSTSIQMSLLGVVFDSISLGIGQICLPALTSHYSKSTLSAWTAGTGASSIIPSLAYSVLSEPKFFNLSTRTVTLVMLIVPMMFALSYWFVLSPAPTVHRMELLKPSTWIVPAQKTSRKIKINVLPEPLPSIIKVSTNGGEKNKNINNLQNNTESYLINTNEQAFTHEFSLASKLKMILPLQQYMLPLTIVYLAEYISNSGLFQLIHFDCDHSFDLSLESQFRWYFTLYMFGVFCVRSVIVLINVPSFILCSLPFIQCLITAILYFQSLHFFIPHISIVFVLAFIQGGISGISYGGTLDRIHKKSDLKAREFNMAVVATSDTTGICLAGFASIFIHNYICSRYLNSYP